MFLNIVGIKVEERLQEILSNSFEGELVFSSSLNEGLKIVSNDKYDILLIDSSEIDNDDLLSFIPKVKVEKPKTLIFIMSSNTTLNLVVNSIKGGAHDYLLKPIEAEEVVKLIKQAIKNQGLKAERIDGKRVLGSRLIGQTKEIVEVYKMIGKVASNRVPVLIKGEKGTGKSSVANAIHIFSDYSKSPFVSINCIAYQDELLERKLFGYLKINAIGEEKTEKGVFERANGGTLHLNNIEAMSVEVQTKLLAFLQEGELTPLGASTFIKPDVRIIATTNKDIGELINQGEFIEELYHRLQVLEIELPPLRNRKTDIPLIIDYSLQFYNEEFQKEIKGVSKPAMKKIMSYDWPGNVRELKNAMRSAVAICRGDLILIEDLPTNIDTFRETNQEESEVILKKWLVSEVVQLREQGKDDFHNIIISRVEAELLKQVLEQTGGKKVETAKLLGITRNTLRSKIKQYNLE